MAGSATIGDKATRVSRGSDPHWDSLVAKHTGEVAAFIAALDAVPPRIWSAPRADNAWSPAQIAQHILATYTILQRELDGGEGLRVRVSWWLRPILRMVFLRRILNGKPLGRKATAPRPTRPEGEAPSHAEVTAALRAAARRAIVSLHERHLSGARGVTHPFFGHVAPDDAVRFLAWHAWHHRQQVEARSS